MLTKKPTLLWSTCNALGGQYSTQSACNSKTSSTRPQYNRQPSARRRPYATISDGTSPKEETQSDGVTSDLWPEIKHPQKIPDPYQILNLQRGARYVKTERFYSLVKLYHPDRNEQPGAICLTHSESLRIERYRLIIAAHTILSDPEKRNAYDLYGAGWTGATTPAPSFTYSETARKAAMGNATWEDWERWYDKYRPPDPKAPPRQPQATLYTSNTAFISVIAILAALGGIGQATRAGETSASFIAQRDAAHTRTARALADEKARSFGMTRDERIEEFLRNRDPAAYDDETVRAMLLDPDICESGAATAVDRENDFRRRYK